MPIQIIAAVIAAAAALIGAAVAAGDNAKAQAIREDIARKYGDVRLPVLDRLVAQKLPPDAAERYSKMTQAMQTQSDVLGKFNEVINEKGETADDRAAYLRMRNEAGGIANSTNSAVQRNMASRGMAGSGVAFALQQQGAQSAVNRANASGIQAAADARGRYMQALNQAGTLSGQMRGQELDAMKAQDAINEFNARQQAEADRYNAGINQQNFDNDMELREAEANARNGVAGGYDRQADRTRSTAAGVGNAASTMGGYETEEEKYKKGAGGK